MDEAERHKPGSETAADAAASTQEDVGGRSPDPPPGGGDSLGDPRVDAAVSSLRELDQRDLDEHPEVYERAHEALRQALDEDDPTAGTPSIAQ